MKKVIVAAILLPLISAGIYRIWFTSSQEPEAPVTTLGYPSDSDTAPVKPTAKSAIPASENSFPTQAPTETPSENHDPSKTSPPDDTSVTTDNLYSRFENEEADPQWSQEHEILIETFLFGSPGYVDLDIESITCKSTLCEIKVSEKDNTVWARVAHELARDQGWESTAWKYADYYDANGKRIIHAVVGKSR